MSTIEELWPVAELYQFKG